MDKLARSSDVIDQAVWRGMVLEALKHLDDILQTKASVESVSDSRDQIMELKERLDQLRVRCETACTNKANASDLKTLEQMVHDGGLVLANLQGRVAVWGLTGGIFGGIVAFLANLLISHIRGQ